MVTGMGTLCDHRVGPQPSSFTLFPKGNAPSALLLGSRCRVTLGSMGRAGERVGGREEKTTEPRDSSRHGRQNRDLGQTSQFIFFRYPSRWASETN